MEPLEQAIVDANLSVAFAAGDQDSVIAAALNVQDQTLVDRRRYSLAAIGQRCAEILGDPAKGDQAQAMFADTLQTAIESKTPGYAQLIVAQQALAAGLLTLHEPHRQAFIAALGKNWPADLLDAVRRCGADVASRAQLTIGRDVTISDLQQLRRDVLWRDVVRPELDAAQNEYLSGNTAAAATRLQAIIDGLV